MKYPNVTSIKGCSNREEDDKLFTVSMLLRPREVWPELQEYGLDSRQDFSICKIVGSSIGSPENGLRTTLRKAAMTNLVNLPLPLTLVGL